MLTLRPYQRECLEAIHKLHSQGKHRQLISLPTAAGKTIVFSHLIKQVGGRTLVLAHTCELLDQARDKIKMVCPGLEVGLVNSRSKCFDAPVVISSVQAASVPANLANLAAQGFDLVIADECHHFAAESPRKVLSHLGFGEGTTRLLTGFSATCFRADGDGKGLGEVFDIVAYERSIKEMIDDGYLCTPRGLKIATDIDFSKVKTADGDFQAASLAKIMDTPEMNEIVVNAYRDNAGNSSAICFGVNVEHAIRLSEQFSSAGISSKAIYGEMPRQERAAILNEYLSGSITVLCNCHMLTEGFDAPHTSCVIVAKPTRSRGLYQQMVGRGLRLWPNKRECLVLDCNDKNHSICSAALLVRDSEVSSTKKQIAEEKKEILDKLPAKLNQKLKAAIINFDPLGESFTWEHEGKTYFMRGCGKLRLEIIPQGDTYQVTCANSAIGQENRLVASGLSFEYAFAAAEDFAKANRQLFVVSDMGAPWRDLPITDRQVALIRSRGYRAGIENLNRGQASTIIASGALKRAI